MYPAAAIINASRYQGSMPGGIAVCVVPEDAVACVGWARETGVPFAVRSGGHSYAGFSTSTGLVVDVKGMRSVELNPSAGTVTVAGGANNADVGAASAPYQAYFPAGRCPTVGAAGLTLGGGWGFSNRLLGPTCDSLVSTDLVVASGELVTASADEHADLFWAVRGGGGGNFGVHTSFTYSTVGVGDVTVCSLSWTGGETAALVEALNRVQVDGPRELGLRMAIYPSTRMPSTQPGAAIVDVVGLFWGTPAELEELLAPCERIQAPDVRTINALPFAEAVRFLRTSTPNGAYGLKSGFVKGALSAEGIDTTLAWLAEMPGFPSRDQDSTIGLYCWGGKVGDVAPDASAFVHRAPDLMFKCEVLWEPQDDPGLIAANLEWLEGYHAAMQPYLAGGAYQNFPDRSQHDWAEAYYGENLARLRQVKRAWDPDNLFRFEQSIPVG
jgi:FAD/FMN-containing dehydrogenase